MHRCFITLAVALMLAVPVTRLNAQDAPITSAPATTGQGVSWALLICGHPGDIAHREQFAATIESLSSSFTRQLGVAPDRIRVQFGADVTEADGPAVRAARGKATRSELTAELEDLRGQLHPEDTLWVVVLGHAHFDGRKSYLNLPGAGEGQSDLHEDEFAQMFRQIPATRQVFLMTTPVSGFFIRTLSAPGRIVITATEADREVNETLFPAALSEELELKSAEDFDVDGDGRCTLFDLYIRVTRNVAQRYLNDMLLATEHAQLDDNGDARGTELQLDYLTEQQGGRAREGFEPPRFRPNSDGYLAQQFVLPLVFPDPPTPDAASPSAAEPSNAN